MRSRDVLAVGAAVLVLAAAGVALYVYYFAPLIYPYWGDGPAYIEAARSLQAGEPLLYSVPFGYRGEWQIFRLWPPGYPVIIAAVAQVTGADAGIVALWLTRLSVLLLPLAAYWAIYRAVGVPIAAAAAALSFSSVGMLPFSLLVSSDPPFSLAAVLSLGVLLRGVSVGDAARSQRLLILAGLLAGLAICIRNIGVALVLAEGIAIAALWLARDGSFAKVFRQGLGYGAGVALAVAPLVAWNLAAFGVLRPYNMPPSVIGFGENLAYLVAALLFDLLSLVRPGPAVAPFVAAAAIAGAVAIGTLGLWHLRAPPRRDDGIDAGRMRGAFLIAATCYGLLSAAVIVAASSRYEWGELIGKRHVAPFDWLLAAAALCALAPLLDKWRATLAVVSAVVAVLLAARVWYFVGAYDWTAADHAGRSPQWARPETRPASGEEPRAVAQAFFRSAAAAKLIARIPDHCDIVSNAAQVIQVSHKRRARSVLEPVAATDIFANPPKPSVFVFMALPGVDLDGLQPPGPGYGTIRDPLFVAFEDPACRAGGTAP